MANSGQEKSRQGEGTTFQSQREERLILLLPKEVIPCVECGNVEGTPCWEEHEEKWKQWRGHRNPRQTCGLFRVVVAGAQLGMYHFASGEF